MRMLCFEYKCCFFEYESRVGGAMSNPIEKQSISCLSDPKLLKKKAFHAYPYPKDWKTKHFMSTRSRSIECIS